MSRAGRPNIPDKIKKVKGTFRKDRENDQQPLFPIVKGVPPAPDHLSSFALEEWKSVTVDLINLNILQTVDLSILAAYCQEMGEYWRCQAKLKNGRVFMTPSGYVQQRPEVSMANKALANALSIASKFGFSPVDRQKMKIQKKEGKEIDPFREMLNGKS